MAQATARTPTKRRVFLRDAAFVLLLNTCVGLILALIALAVAPQADAAFRQQVLLRQLGFAQAIGFSIFGLIEALRLTLWWQRRPGLPAMALACAAAIPLGYGIGVVLASWLLSLPLVLPRSLAPGPAMAVVLVVTVLASLAAVVLLTQRDRLEAERLRAENADVRAASARLQLLQQQIEPHMLFNTLANVHALIDEEPARAQQLLEALSELLHASMQTGDQSLVTLRQEFGLLEQYLRLMAIRMGPRLDYALHLPPELAQSRLPPLTVQPLVENAIRHGLDPRPSGGRLRVAARREGAQLIVEVTDDGPGLQGEDPFAAGRIGLANIRKRLAVVFGDGASLHIGDNAPQGVRATLTLPA